MHYKKVTVHEQFRENPFVEKAIEDIKLVKRQQVIRPKNRDEIQMITSSDGEVTGYTAFTRFIEVDEEKFAKVYLSQFASFWELSRAAIRVFGYILTVLQPKKDFFTFKMDKCLEYTGYKSKKDVLSGIGNLIECNIIARSMYDYEYFVNPLVVFNGDRVAFTKMYVKKKKEAQKDTAQLDLFGADPRLLTINKPDATPTPTPTTEPEPEPATTGPAGEVQGVRRRAGRSTKK